MTNEEAKIKPVRQAYEDGIRRMLAQKDLAEASKMLEVVRGTEGAFDLSNIVIRESERRGFKALDTIRGFDESYGIPNIPLQEMGATKYSLLEEAYIALRDQVKEQKREELG